MYQKCQRQSNTIAQRCKHGISMFTGIIDNVVYLAILLHLTRSCFYYSFGRVFVLRCGLSLALATRSGNVLAPCQDRCQIDVDLGLKARSEI